jgi:hypothetical protein
MPHSGTQSQRTENQVHTNKRLSKASPSTAAEDATKQQRIARFFASTRERRREMGIDVAIDAATTAREWYAASKDNCAAQVCVIVSLHWYYCSQSRGRISRTPSIRTPPQMTRSIRVPLRHITPCQKIVLACNSFSSVDM